MESDLCVFSGCLAVPQLTPPLHARPRSRLVEGLNSLRVNEIIHCIPKIPLFGHFLNSETRKSKMSYFSGEAW